VFQRSLKKKQVCEASEPRRSHSQLNLRVSRDGGQADDLLTLKTLTPAPMYSHYMNSAGIVLRYLSFLHILVMARFNSTSIVLQCYQ